MKPYVEQVKNGRIDSKQSDTTSNILFSPQATEKMEPASWINLVFSQSSKEKKGMEPSRELFKVEYL